MQQRSQIPQRQNEQQSNRRIILTILLIAAFGLRTAWVLWLPSIPVSDFGWYYDRALSILAGHGYSIAGHSTAQYPPAYPYFLAFLLWISRGLLGVKLAQAVIGTFSCYLVYRIARLVASERVALLATALIAVYPDYIFFSNLLASENLFIPLMLGTILLILDDSLPLKLPVRIGASGLMLGLAALTRPAILLFPVVFLIWLIIKRTRFSQAIGYSMLMGVLMLAVILPWTVRNSVALGQPVLISSNGGTVFWMSNSSGAAKYGSGGRYYPPHNPIEQTKGEIARSDLGYRLTIAAIKANPRQFVDTISLKYRRFFRAPDGLGWNLLDSKDHNWTKEILNKPFYVRPIGGFNPGIYNVWKRNLTMMAYFMWGMTGLGFLMLLRFRRTQYASLLLLLYGYWFLFHLIFAFGHPRFVMPLASLNAILIASFLVGAVETTTSWFESRTGRLIIGYATIIDIVAGMLAIALWLPPLMNSDNMIDQDAGLMFGVCALIAFAASTVILWRARGGFADEEQPDTPADTMVLDLRDTV
ncbi:MAG TPA: glycosyltransferase family 39 protein [Candidatus Aquicultor sp.]